MVEEEKEPIPEPKPPRKRKYISVKQEEVKNNLAGVLFDLAEMQKRLDVAGGGSIQD